MFTKRYIKHHIVFSIMELDKLASNLSTTYELHANEEEKDKLLNDIVQINFIKEMIKNLEVNGTRFGMRGAL